MRLNRPPRPTLRRRTSKHLILNNILIQLLLIKLLCFNITIPNRWAFIPTHHNLPDSTIFLKRIYQLIRHPTAWVKRQRTPTAPTTSQVTRPPLPPKPPSMSMSQQQPSTTASDSSPEEVPPLLSPPPDSPPSLRAAPPTHGPARPPRLHARIDSGESVDDATLAGYATLGSPEEEVKGGRLGPSPPPVQGQGRKGTDVGRKESGGGAATPNMREWMTFVGEGMSDSEAGHGLLAKDKGKGRAKDEDLTGEDVRIITSERSQYSLGGMSACGLASMNAAREILTRKLGGNEIDGPLLDGILDICAFWTSEKHLDIDMIHSSMPLFQRSLVQTEGEEVMTKTDDSFEDILSEMSSSPNTAVIVTRPPEIILLCYLSDHSIVLFDSHPRPTHTGAAFLVFSSIPSAVGYLNNLFPTLSPNAGDEEIGWQAELLFNLSLQSFGAKPLENGKQHWSSFKTTAEDKAEVFAANCEALQARMDLQELKSERATEVERLNRRLDDMNGLLDGYREKERNQLEELRIQSESVQPHGQKPVNVWRPSPPPKPKPKPQVRGFGGGFDVLAIIEQQERLDKFKAEKKERDKEKEKEKEKRTSGSIIDTFGLGRRRSDKKDTVVMLGRNNSVTSVRFPKAGPGPGHQSHEGSSRISTESTSPAPSRSSASNPRPPSTISMESAHTPHSIQGTSASTSVNSTTAPPAPPTSQPIPGPPSARYPPSRPIPKPWAVSPQSTASHSASNSFHPLLPLVDVGAVSSFERQRSPYSYVPPPPTTFECNICFEEQSLDDLGLDIKCKHKTCRECFYKYLTSSLRGSQFPILCPASGCALSLMKNEAEILFQTEEDVSKWDELELSFFAIPLKCPSCKREALVDRDQFLEAKKHGCPVGCGYFWCGQCHARLSAMNEEHECGAKDLESLMKTMGWKRCPTCATNVEKVEGCNHMSCPVASCSTHFCYVDHGSLVGALIVKSNEKKDIDKALKEHYKTCKLFEYDHIQ
ncbi:hypothetical protein BT69DRAFT_616487 [Atractiella rhizophila]|nr:hypothetical protein BT69DRAFT_616487 [Atractiella rhizophila]